MTIQLSNATAIATADALAARVEVGTGTSLLRVYEGVKPVDVDTAIGAQTLLVEFELPVSFFAAAVDANPGAIAVGDVDNIATTPAAATGTAAFFRIINRNGDAVFQGTVTAVSGGGDVEISSTSIIAAIDVTVVTLNLGMPEGA